MERRTTTKDLRRRHRAMVLRRFVSEGESSRAEIAAATNLSLATVTHVVTELLGEGLVREVGLVPSDGGRPISRIAVAEDGAYLIGADIGEHGVTVELFDLALKRIDRVFRSLTPHDVSPGEISNALSDGIRTLRGSHPEASASLIGVGLGLPGIVETDPSGVATVYAQTLGWHQIVIDEGFCPVDLPLYADNGAKTLATAEHWFGAAKGTSHAIVALVGRGLGVGVVADGRVLRGASSSAGEWGHIKVSFGGPRCACGQRGCLEAYVGAEAIIRRWLEAGAPAEDDELSLAGFLTAAEGGQAQAVTVLDETIEILGLGVANLVNLFNPDRIVIGGWAGRLLYRARGEQLARAFREHCLDRPGERVRLAACLFGDDAVALGAALLPLEHLISGAIPAPGSVDA